MPDDRPYILGKMRSMSWSAISSFEWDPEQWYQGFFLGIKTDSKEMAFGRMIDQRIQDNPNFIPSLPRYPVMQYRISAQFDGLPLIGVPDTFRNLPARKGIHKPGMRDYKTGKRAWDQKRADETGQLDMYCFLMYLKHKIRPEEFELWIDWLPTIESGDFGIEFRDNPVIPVSIETHRTMKQILTFGSRIKTRYKEMQAYAKQRQKK